MTQKNMAVVYHSNFGHTRRVAKTIAAGACEVLKPDQVHLVDTEAMDWQKLDDADLIVFGSAVYMGSVTAEFKAFMDASSSRWFERSWQGKWAAGFANSGGLSGDKLAVLQQLCLFAMQHGMHWTGFTHMPTGHSPKDINRLSGFLGLMTQSDNAPPEQTPPEGDMASARLFGMQLANTL